jgi:hypothetical protein
MAEAFANGITSLVPMVHVADLQRSVDFYKLMGLEARGSFATPPANCSGFTLPASEPK